MYQNKMKLNNERTLRRVSRPHTLLTHRSLLAAKLISLTAKCCI